MSWYKNRYFLFFLLFILMLVDGQLSNLFSSLFSYHFRISSHIWLLSVILFYQKKDLAFALLSSLFLGLLFDIYYLDIFGLVTFLLPLLVYASHKINSSFWESFFQTLLVFIVLLFVFEMLGFLLSELYGRSAFSLVHYITYGLAPTLIFNIIKYVVLQNILKWLFFEK